MISDLCDDNILNICSFLSYRLINETFGENMIEKIIYCFPQYNRKNRVELYKWAIRNNKLNVCKHIQQYDEIKNINKKQDSIILACIYNRKYIVDFLLKKENIDPTYKNNLLIHMACNYGFKDIVEILLGDNRVDPSDNFNGPLRISCSNGNLDIVKLLINDRKVTLINYDEQIKCACLNGHYHIVDYILTHI